MTQQWRRLFGAIRVCFKIKQKYSMGYEDRAVAGTASAPSWRGKAGLLAG
jgi:hypothetical protein